MIIGLLSFLHPAERKHWKFRPGMGCDCGDPVGVWQFYGDSSPYFELCTHCCRFFDLDGVPMDVLPEEVALFLLTMEGSQ